MAGGGNVPQLETKTRHTCRQGRKLRRAGRVGLGQGVVMVAGTVKQAGMLGARLASGFKAQAGRVCCLSG